MGTYLVGLVVILWIVLENFGLLGILKIADQIVCAEALAPFLIFDEPVTAVSLLVIVVAMC